MSRLRAVVFDVGETLYSEERAWGAWADWLGVSPRTLGAALGATLALRADHRTAFELIRPGVDLQAEQAARAAAGRADDPSQLYRGILIKIIFTVLLIKGIRSASRSEALSKELGKVFE